MELPGGDADAAADIEDVGAGAGSDDPIHQGIGIGRPSVVDARRAAQNTIALAVWEARAATWSWDKISTALGGTPNGETLRRNFGGEKETATRYRH